MFNSLGSQYPRQHCFKTFKFLRGHVLYLDKIPAGITFVRTFDLREVAQWCDLRGVAQWCGAMLRTGWSGVWVPEGAGSFSLHHCVQTGSIATQPPLSLGVKRPGREADHSLPSSAEVKNMWSYSPTQLKHRDNSPLPLNYLCGSRTRRFCVANTESLQWTRSWATSIHLPSSYLPKIEINVILLCSQVSMTVIISSSKTSDVLYSGMSSFTCQDSVWLFLFSSELQVHEWMFRCGNIYCW
jgi:hypothetical protein